MSGGEIIFERVHVWRELGDLVENDSEIEGYDERYQMKGAVDQAEEKVRKHYFELGVVCVEQSLPLVLGLATVRVLSPRHNGGEHEERNQTSVDNGSKYHVAG